MRCWRVADSSSPVPPAWNPHTQIIAYTVFVLILAFVVRFKTQIFAYTNFAFMSSSCLFNTNKQIIWGAQSHSRRDDPVTAYL